MIEGWAKRWTYFNKIEIPAIMIVRTMADRERADEMMTRWHKRMGSRNVLRINHDGLEYVNRYLDGWKEQ